MELIEEQNLPKIGVTKTENIDKEDVAILLGQESKNTPEEDLKYSVINSFKEDIATKKKYAWVLLRILGLLVFFSSLVFVLIGLGWLTYDEATVNVFLGSVVVQVIGLVALVVKYLFSSDKYIETLKYLNGNCK